MEKKKLLFKIIGAMTLALPISITLVVSAIWSKPTPDYVITFNDALAVDLETINEKVVITEHDDKNKALVIAFDEFTFIISILPITIKLSMENTLLNISNTFGF